MRMNKYLRNRAFHQKHWNRIRAKTNPYYTLCPYILWSTCHPWWSHEEQVKDHFKDIEKQARALENGHHAGEYPYNAPAPFRRMLNQRRKAAERQYMAKLRQGDYDAVEPKFRKDAACLWW